MPTRRWPLLLLIGMVGALNVHPGKSTDRTLSRRKVAASALGIVPLLAAQASHAGFATKYEDISEEKLKELAQNRQNFGDFGASYRTVCARDDLECLKNKRESAKANFLSGPQTKEERVADIKKQANACRGFCSRPDLMMQCDGRDKECLAEKKRLFEEAGGASGKDFLPVVGLVLAAIVARVATRPEKTENPKGLQIREQFYAKRKADTQLAKELGFDEVGAFNQGAFARAKAEFEAKKKASGDGEAK